MAIRLAVAARRARERFGAPTRLVSSVVTVATTRTRLLRNNPDRFAWVIANRSGNDGAIDVDPGMTFATGLPILNSGVISMEVDTDGEAVTYEVFGINTVAGGDWRVWEFLAGE